MLSINFHLLLGEPDTVLPEFVKSHNVGGLITDFTPLRKPLKWLKDVTAKLPKNFPVGQVSYNYMLCDVQVFVLL